MTAFEGFSSRQRPPEGKATHDAGGGVAGYFTAAIVCAVVGLVFQGGFGAIFLVLSVAFAAIGIIGQGVRVGRRTRDRDDKEWRDGNG